MLVIEILVKRFDYGVSFLVCRKLIRRKFNSRSRELMPNIKSGLRCRILVDGVELVGQGDQRMSQ